MVIIYLSQSTVDIQVLVQRKKVAKERYVRKVKCVIVMLTHVANSHMICLL
jgi:hypothetical protein